MNRKNLVIAALVSLAIAAVVHAADSGERGKVGYELTKALNGAPEYITTVQDDAGTACNQVVLDDGINVMVACNQSAFVGNSSCDGGTQSAVTLPVAADEKFLLGMLKPGQPRVTVESRGALTDCKIFRVR